LLNGKVYIGQTINSPCKRWKSHCSLNGNCTKLQNAMKKYGKDNFDFKILFEIETELLGLYESLYIRQYDSVILGYNLKDGGKHGPLSDATRKKISEAHKGKKHIVNYAFTEEHKQKISESRKGMKFTKEHKEKLSEKAKNRTKEHKEKLSKAKEGHTYNNGRIHTEQTRKNMSEAHKGVKLSENHKKSLSLARKGRVVSEETRKKISEKQKGKVISEETRQRLIKAGENKEGFKVVINGKEYKSMNFASGELGISQSTLRHRVLSENFPGYKRV